ncbi:AGR168Wp [Eremothecium gossypii ATCC 10895]|uniref:Protein HIR1 n=1 Tax=Eremothecium gossypii (strain ATCC 10895 / CBS 109.51 / FGSC 9923 / NRRL Y-1056) TaxID=284811 RepID=HIR1_EREGS|nr:AGR168Wp [Eremothecium gossypii ATCC 10895]Q74ZN0.2 RecName: Full=Protein HIR1 [Eremothecium gossypii ATCC 10895]AAS54658.2 AGR168Wp [Eremothecium gossypii ATCC 10895]
MKILKLPWLTHQEGQRNYEIYTVDVSSDGQRVATGGLDGKIRIWSVADILVFAKPKVSWPAREEQLRKPLANMSRHTGSVTALKFSPDNKYLASGSDDKILLIWEKEEGAVQPLFDMENDLEHWNVRRRLVAHDNDIQDICWAPDSSILVTVGLDRSIIVWNGSTFEKIKRFDVHQSHVKGVVFDPANKYFATASDDRTVKVFRYHKGTDLSFTIEHIITEPFQGSPLTTYFRRLSWSPDGQHIAVPNATNGPVSTVAIISRGNWDTSVSLVGHDQPTEVACFNPRLFEHNDNHERGEEVDGASKDNSAASESSGKRRLKDDDRVDSVIATAGQDKTLAVWSTSRARPIFVAYDLTSKSVTDIAWTCDGTALFLTSLDGRIIVITFEEGELGKAIPLEQNVEQLHRYGVDKDSLVFPESVKQLILEDKARQYKKPYIETTLLESRIGTVKKPNVLNPRPKHAKNDVAVASIPQAQAPALKKKEGPLNAATVQNGKKRVAPTLISTGYARAATVKFEPRSSIDSDFAGKKEPLKDTSYALAGKISQPSLPLPRLGVHTLIMGVKERGAERFYVEDEESMDDDAEVADEEDETKNEHPLTLNLKTTPERVWKDEPNLRYLEYPGVIPDADVVICQYGDLDDLHILEIRNGVERSIQFDREALFENPTKILGYHQGERTLEAFLPEVVISCVGSKACQCWALATASGSLYIYGNHGQLLVPKISIGHKVIKLIAWQHFVIAFTETCLFWIWDIRAMKLVEKEISVLPVLVQDQPQCNRVRISRRILDFRMLADSHELLVEMSDGASYVWKRALGCWTDTIGQSTPVTA